MIHIPTGTIETRQGRHRESNFQEAKTAVIKKITNNHVYMIQSQLSDERKNQAGSGDRGTYFRTYSFQHGFIKDFRTNKQIPIRQFNRGRLWLLWK